MTVVSTSLGRQEWGCEVGLAEGQLGLSERRREGAFSGIGKSQRHGQQAQPGEERSVNLRKAKSGETGSETLSRSGVCTGPGGLRARGSFLLALHLLTPPCLSLSAPPGTAKHLCLSYTR